MSRVFLFECSPRRPSDGVAVVQRYCFNAPGPANYLGKQWEPVISDMPEFSSGIGFDGRQFAAAPEPQNGDLTFILSNRTRGAAGLVWKNAPYTIKMAAWPVGGGNPADGAFTTIATGQVDEMTAGETSARVTLLDAGQPLRDPAIVTKFGSRGDSLLDLADAVKDRPADAIVPQAWGHVLGIPGLLVDRANLIYLFANSAATTVAGFYDGGAAFTMGVARASLAALQANVPAPGQVDYCLSAGGKLLARPWDTPNYPFTADAVFGSTKPADICAAIVASRTTVAFKAGAVAAFNAVQAAACGIYVDDDASIAALLDRVLGGVGAMWRLTSAGTIDVQRIGFGSPVATIKTLRGRPTRERIIVPTGRRSLGYGRNWRVHSESEIAAIVLAGDLAYADGTTVEALKPSQAGADVTANAQAVMNLPAGPVVLADYAGTVEAGQLPRTLGATRFRGTSNVTTTTAWSISTVGCTATIGAATGLIEITAVATTGKIIVTSVRDGVTLTGEFAVIKQNAPPPVSGGGGGGSSSASDSSISSTSSTSYGGANAGPLTVRAGSGGTVFLSAPLTVSTSGATSGIAGKWQWRVVGGSWADVSSEIADTLDAIASEPASGYIEVTQTKSGLTNGVDYEFQLLLRRVGGSGTLSFSGVASAVA